MKKVLKILTLVMLIITIIKIGDTYSKYYASANTNNLFQDVGAWIIKVNEMDIYSEDGDTVEFTLENFGNFTNPNTDPTKISPGNKGYTDIVIDPTGTDVAVRYDIEFNEAFLESKESTGINISLELQNPTENMQFVKISENKYSGTISLADIQENQKATIRYYIEWTNDDNNESRNEFDTMLATYGERLTIVPTVLVTVTQYLGEPLQ